MKELFVEPVSKEEDYCLSQSIRTKQDEARNKMRNTTQWDFLYVTKINCKRMFPCCCPKKTQKDLLEIKAYKRLEKEVQITYIL